MATMQNVVDMARLPLSDADKVRYTDLELLGYVNSALRTLRLKRPDIFYGQYGSAMADKAIGAAFPIDDMYIQAVADYATARCHVKEDEAAMLEKASSFFSLFKEQAS
jgi:hypothetical protein